MDTVIVAVIIIVLIILSIMTLTVSMFQSADSLSDAWKNMEEQSVSISETGISAAGNCSGELINVAVQNTGRSNLYDYPKWDAIIQYQSGNACHLSYTEALSPESGEWAIEGIFMAGGSPEVFDPNILNPGEEMRVAIYPNLGIDVGETARIVISTPNGVTSQCFVTK